MGSEITDDELEEVILTWLSQQKADILEAVYEVIQLECGEGIQGKRMKLLNGLLAHLVSLNETQSPATIMKMYDFMRDRGVADIKPTLPALEDLNKMSVGASAVVAGGLSKSSVVDLVRLKELKITGTIFGKGESRISLTSLDHQIRLARKLKT